MKFEDLCPYTLASKTSTGTTTVKTKKTINLRSLYFLRPTYKNHNGNFMTYHNLIIEKADYKSNITITDSVSTLIKPVHIILLILSSFTHFTNCHDINGNEMHY